MSQPHLLVAFDFDHTIVEENSDTVARKLISAELIPEDIRKLYHTEGWTEYMSQIFKLLHQNKVSQQTIVDAMKKLTPSPQMPELFHWLNFLGHEIIIISDSNSVFIEEWLKGRGLTDCFQQVFTNPASFEESGLLTIRPYHFQDWCKLSTKNLCKGYILETYIEKRLEEGVKFDAVAYVGDGQNDFCPSLKLKEGDLVFPRAGFALEGRLNDPAEENKVIAQVNPWKTAAEIKDKLEKLLSKDISVD